MSFEKAMGKMKYDIRLLEYNLSQGFITQEEYNKHLGQLEDSAHLISVETAVADEEDSDIDADDDGDVDAEADSANGSATGMNGAGTESH